MDCVTAIGVKNPDNGSNSWIGTGFLVGRFLGKDGDKKTYHIFLVTNKHVLAGHKNIIVRFNPVPSTGNTVKDYPVEVVDAHGKSKWIGHPREDIDVAVLYINPEILLADSRKFAIFRSDEHVLPLKAMAEREISEGDFIYALGFPMGLVDFDAQYVIARLGIIARIKDTLERRKTEFIADISNYPGNSGSPIVSKPEFVSIAGTKYLDKSYLLGILRGYIPYIDAAVSKQTGRTRITFEENSGLALVIPADYIMETIEVCYKMVTTITEKTVPTPSIPST